MQVVKRDGTTELLDLQKFHSMVAAACEGLPGVSASQVEMTSGIQFFDGITTRDIQAILVKSAADLISLDAPNYQYVAARLQLYGLRKSVFGQFEPKSLYQMVTENVEKELYDGEILSLYTREEFDILDQFVRFDRDLNFTYAGLSQLIDKYLIQDRVSHEVFEVPQHMYVLIAALLFAKYPAETRMDYVKRYYDAISTFRINLPTPILAGVRTATRQFSSCVLIAIDDSLDSIFTSDMAIGKYVAQRAGIGFDAGRIRAKGSKVRKGDVKHTGVIPFLKKFEATIGSCSQGGVRNGAATCTFPIWHEEIMDILVLKNNAGTDDTRVRRLDYAIQLSKLFYERFLRNESISLFSPHLVPGLYDSFGQPEFDALYVKYENDKRIPKKTIDARELFSSLIKERSNTGRIYITNIDHFNSHSSILDPLYASNLCMEIGIAHTPLNHIDDGADTDAEIGTCILSAINLGLIKNLSDFEPLCDLAVRALDVIVDYQTYPVKAAEISAKARRNIGVGFIGLAHYLAKNKLKYSSPQAWELMDRTTEAFQYYLLKASNRLAQERGACSAFNRTKYSHGILPIDTYKRDVDQIVTPNYQMDWETLRADIRQYGLRNSTLSCMMPSESSSVISNATNGLEMPRGYLSVKGSKQKPLKQIVPGYSYLKNNYSLLWDQTSNTGYFNTLAVIQKYIDQSMSTNTSYNPEHYENNEVPMSVMVGDILTAYKLGFKTLYYHNVNDGATDDDLVTSTPSASGTVVPQDDCDSCKI